MSFKTMDDGQVFLYAVSVQVRCVSSKFFSSWHCIDETDKIIVVLYDEWSLIMFLLVTNIF